MSNIVALKKFKPHYPHPDSPEFEQLKSAIRELLDNIGGIEKFITSDKTVLIKPNIVMGMSPEKGATTHPSVFYAVIELIKECNPKRIMAGDSPGIGSGRSAGEKAGLYEAAMKLGVDWVEFTPEEVTDDSRMFRRLRLAKEVLNADVVINLPRLKTHGMMLLTCAMKNMFGSVIGVDKFHWHQRAGRDAKKFARMLYEIYRAAKPTISIVDAIISMDGTGPTHGTTNPTGFLAAGEDGCSVDAVMLKILRVNPSHYAMLQAAEEMGDIKWKNCATVGDTIESLHPAGWTWPLPHDASMVLGTRWMGKIKWIKSLQRKLFATKPIITSNCTKCSICVRACPVQVMKLTTNKQNTESISINRDACIHCYCCHELCPHGAIELRHGILGRFFFRKTSH